MIKSFKKRIRLITFILSNIRLRVIFTIDGINKEMALHHVIHFDTIIFFSSRDDDNE